jgi:hypothetical protein
MPATSASSNCFWICPVCKSPFMHRQSFKGHILRLRDPISISAHCFLDENNPEHQRWVSHPRYGDGSFDDRRHQFAEQFYETVRSHTSSGQCWPNSLRAVGLCCVDYVTPIASHHPIETCRRSMSGCLVESRIYIYMPFPPSCPIRFTASYAQLLSTTAQQNIHSNSSGL